MINISMILMMNLMILINKNKKRNKFNQIKKVYFIIDRESFLKIKNGFLLIKEEF